MIKRFINSSSPVDVVNFGAEALKRCKGYGLIITRPLRSGDCLMTSEQWDEVVDTNLKGIFHQIMPESLEALA